MCFAEREPCRRKAGREFHGLCKQVRGRGKIAALRKIARKRVAAVGGQVAGGLEQSGCTVIWTYRLLNSQTAS